MGQLFTTLVNMFSKIKLKSVKTKNKEQIQLHLFYCKMSTIF